MMSKTLRQIHRFFAHECLSEIIQLKSPNKNNEQGLRLTSLGGVLLAFFSQKGLWESQNSIGSQFFSINSVRKQRQVHRTTEDY